MQIPVLIESAPAGGYQVRSGEPFSLVVDGATPEDALTEFKDRVAAKLRDGARLASVEVPSDHSWLPFAGMFSETDPLIEQWLEAIHQERNRTEDAG